MKQLIRLLFLFWLLTGCASAPQSNDEAPGFWTKLRHGAGSVLSGMGGGLQQASQKEPTQQVTQTQPTYCSTVKSGYSYSTVCN